MTVFSAESIMSKEPLDRESDMEDENPLLKQLQEEQVTEEDGDSDYEEGNDIDINSLPSSPCDERDIDTNDRENIKTVEDQTRLEKDDKDENEDSSVKPTHSYIALIAMAILSSPSKKMILGDIYQYIQDNYPYYRNKDKSWRNSIRHNLSLNECFIKAGRSENGKGNYWGIHPVNMDDFANGDFRRRRARRRVRKTAALKFGGLAGYGFAPFSSHTPIMSYRADRFCPYPIPCHSHVSCTKNFAIESILSSQENSQLYTPSMHRPLHLPPFHLPSSTSHSYSSLALSVPAATGLPAAIPALSAYKSTSSHRLSPCSTGCSSAAPTESWQETLEKLQAQFRKSAGRIQPS